MINWEACSLVRSLETSEELRGLPLDDVQRIVNSVAEEATHVRQENEIFECYLNANEPTLIADMDNILQKAFEIQRRLSRSFSLIQFQQQSPFNSDTTFKSIKPTDMSRGPRVNLTQKTDLVLREIEETQNSYERFIKKAKKTKFTLRAEIEEISIRAQEIQEASDAFERAVVIKVIGGIVQKIPAEKFVRYMQDWLKNAQIVLEKMRLHTLSFKLQLSKLKAQKTQKLELGESVDVADLEKMQIQKIHMRSEIRQKNINLLEIKHMNSKANLLLVNHKKLLEKQQQKKKELNVTLEEMQKKIEILVVDAELAEEEVEREKKRWSDLKKIAVKYQVPPVMEYIHKKSELRDLKKELKIWRRRQQVQDVCLSTYTKNMCRLMGLKKARESWYGREGRRKSAAISVHGDVYEEEEEELVIDEDESNDEFTVGDFLMYK